MITIVFFIILIIMLLINLQIVRDFFHPTVVFKAVWILSVAILLFYQERWGVSLSAGTVTLFLSGFFSFDLGFFLFYIMRMTTLANNEQINQLETTPIYIKSLKGNRVLLLLFIVVTLSLYLIINIADIMGGFANFFTGNFFTEYRSLKYSGKNLTNNQEFMFRSLETIGVSVIILFLREENKGRHRKFIFILTIMIAIGIQLFTTGRMRFLAVITQFGFLYILNAKKNNEFPSFSNQIKYLRKLMGLIITFFIFFYLYGKYAVNKVSEIDPLHSIAIYTSASLPAFDLTWEIYEKSSPHFGASILSPFYNIV